MIATSATSQNWKGKKKKEKERIKESIIIIKYNNNNNNNYYNNNIFPIGRNEESHFKDTTIRFFLLSHGL
jgi:hypothetical protein